MKISREDSSIDAIKKALKSLEEISDDENVRETERIREKARLYFKSKVHDASLEGIENFQGGKVIEIQEWSYFARP